MEDIKGLDSYKKDSIIVTCTDSEYYKNKFNICCKYCNELNDCIKEDYQCSDIDLDTEDCAYAKY